MVPIVPEEVHSAMQRFRGRPVFLHLETTNGAYAAEGLVGPKMMNVGAFLRNAQVVFQRAVVAGEGPYRVGLQMSGGWVYAEGLTHWEETPANQLLLAGFSEEGRLTVSLELGEQPFPV